jgi:hypothetical protein
MTSILNRTRRVAIVGFALLAVPAGLAQAQITQPAAPPGQPGGRIMSIPTPTPGYMPPYNPYYPGMYSNYNNNANSGVADLTAAQGQLMVSQQQAYQMREGVRSAKIDNKRKAFDEYLYEKERTPTAEQERQKAQAMYLDRARNNPPSVEIWSGGALNTLLQNLKSTAGKGAPGLTAPILPEVLKNINVTSQKGDGNAGLLKDGPKLTWPDALSGPGFKADRDRVDSLLNEAMKQAQFNGQPDRGTVMQIQKDADAIARDLKKDIDSIDMGSYIDAKNFLANLDASIVVLKQKDAANYFNGKYDLNNKAKNVDELVAYMAANGLTFAPAVPGQESAYNALYTAMSSYDVALRSTPNQNR